MNRSSAVRHLAQNAESSSIEPDDDQRDANTFGSFHSLASRFAQMSPLRLIQTLMTYQRRSLGGIREGSSS